MIIPAKDPQRVLIWGDLHCDTFDPASVALLCKIARDFKPTISLCMGDVVNMDQVSSFMVDRDKSAKLQEEIDCFQEVQREINRATGKARRIFLKGNHEQRAYNAIISKLPGLASLKALELPEILGLGDLGIEYADDSVKLGSIEFVHGWFARKWSGVSPRAHLETVGFTHSIVHGHTHRMSMISKATYPDGMVFGVETGHLSDYRKMDYLKAPPDWQRGIVALEWRDGKPAFELIPFFGKVRLTAHWRGKLYRS